MIISKEPVSSIAVVFAKFWLKSTEIRQFLSKFQSFFILHKTLHFGKFQGADFKYNNKSFKLQSKYPKIRHFQTQLNFF